MYDKCSVLRIETTINQPREFQVYGIVHHNDGTESKEWKPIPYQWFRGFYIVGNTEDGCSIFSKIVQASHRGDVEFPFTMGLNQFDFLDYDTFCTYVADAVEQEDITGIINICSGRPEKLADRVERFIEENGFDIELKYGAFPDRPYDSKAIWGDDFKIRMVEKDEKKQRSAKI